MLAATEPLADRLALDLRASWQGKALAAGLYGDGDIARPRDKLGAVVLSVLAHNFDDAMPVLLRVVFPGFRTIAAPFLVSAGKIAKNSYVMADMVSKDGRKLANQGLFRSTREMEGAFRKLADRLRLTDAERVELFDAVKRWVVCDYRLDPNMNPADPDAKRLTVH